MRSCFVSEETKGEMWVGEEGGGQIKGLGKETIMMDEIGDEREQLV